MEEGTGGSRLSNQLWDMQSKVDDESTKAGSGTPKAIPRITRIYTDSTDLGLLFRKLKNRHQPRNRP